VATTEVEGTAARLRGWFLEGLNDRAKQIQGPHKQGQSDHPTHSWWKAMCLTGVDYFSTLGYQPGIAALAAGALSPLATLVLVALTLLGALPIYRRVARESPHGEASIAMLEHILPWWAGKLFVLVLLGFACTDFLITMTLSAADATAHVVENPYVPDVLHNYPVLITLLLLALLGAVFLRGFGEAIGIAVVLVGAYLLLNVVVVGVALTHVATNPPAVSHWWTLLSTEHSSPLAIVGVALLVFPKLALGLSGFETGVAVMPQIRGDASDTEEKPLGRIRGTRKLLTTAAAIMSVFLLTSSFATVVLIPEKEFQPGGAANGRALAFIAHEYLGNAFGTVYDISTITILWFAGASAMAGLLNLVPRYLPRYGMAPQWTRAIRPLVVVFTLIAFVVTILFEANVDKQSGAYATGVLVLITSAAVAVTLSAHRHKQRGKTIGLAIIAVIFAYTTGANIIERPEGIRIAGLFIAGIVIVSFVSRVMRSFELRATEVHFDKAAEKLIDGLGKGPIRIVANEPHERNQSEYKAKEHSQRVETHIPDSDPVLFLEVVLTDPSDFETALYVTGRRPFNQPVLRVNSAVVPNTIAAVLLAIRDRTGRTPHVYFNWTEGNPIAHLLRYLFIGVGEVAPVTREVLRQAEPDPHRRPVVHVA
jgi:hypothetical protein